MAKIAVVDDVAANRALLAAVLRHMGHEPLEATDGIEALALVLAERPDLVICDILMPVMDGFQFVRQLRAEPTLAGLPVIFCSAHYDGRTARDLAAACGVLELLTKPYRLEEIVRAVERTLTCQTVVPLRLPPQATAAFDREHLRLVTDKLSAQTGRLQIADDRLQALIALNLRLASEHDPYHLLRGCRQNSLTY